VLLLAALLVVAVHVPSGSAGASTGVKAGDGWEFRGAAYLWMANIDGTQTVTGSEAELEVDFGDVLDVLDFAGEAHVEGMKDNQWGFFIDGTYLKPGPEAKQGPIHIRVDYKYWLWELGGVYRANTWATRHGHAAVDLLLGGRYTSMDVDLDFQRLPVPNIGGSQSWTDLIAGARLVMDLPNNWSMVLRGDIGGFGIGGSSDLSAQGVLNFRWNFKPTWNLVAGYRALYQDYKTGKRGLEFAYDATTHGPSLGVEYQF
jgi:hypothetical protein